jgi:hypothetical protein
MSDIREYAERKATQFIQSVEKEGAIRVSTCDHSNWDRTLYNSIRLIANIMRKRGYGVEMNVNWGVQDWKFYLLN